MLHDLMQFLAAHWQLSSIFMVLLIYIVFEELRESGLNHALDPAGCVALINDQQAKVWDLRAPELFSKGHIVGAEHVNAKLVVDLWQKLSKKQQQQPVVLVCERGQTASRAVNQLRAAGHQHAVLLRGGMQSWLHDSMPVTTE